MITVAQLTAAIKADISNFMQGMASVGARLSQLVSQTQAMGRQITENTASPWNFMYKAATSALSGTVSGLRQMSKDITDVGRDFNYLAFIAASVLAGIAKNAVQAGFSFIEMSDRAIRGFTAMLGSAKEAQKFFNEIKAFAIPTPFETPQLIQYSQQLKNAGIATKEILPSLKAVGDYITQYSMRGVEDLNGAMLALTQMMYKGKVQAEEITRQFTDHSIPALKMLAAQQGVTTAEMSKMIKQGIVPAEWAFRALAFQMEKRAPNAMIKGAKDMSTAMAGLRDSVNDTLGDLLRPVYEDFTSLVSKVAEVARGMKAVIADLSQDTRRKFVYAFSIATAAAPLTVAIEALTRVFRMSLSPIGMWVAVISSVAYYLSQNRGEAEQFKQAFLSMIPVLLSISKEVSKFVTYIGQQMVPVIKYAVVGIGWLLNGIADLLSWFNKLPPAAKNFILVLQLIGVLFDPIATRVAIAVASFKGLTTVIQILSTRGLAGSIAAFQAAEFKMGTMSKATLIAGMGFKALGQTVSFMISPFTRALTLLTEMPGAMQRVAKGGMGQNILAGITGAFGNAASGARGLGGQIASELKNPVVGAAALSSMQQGLSGLKDKFILVASAAGDAVTSVLRYMMSAGGFRSMVRMMASDVAQLAKYLGGELVQSMVLAGKYAAAMGLEMKLAFSETMAKDGITAASALAHYGEVAASIGPNIEAGLIPSQARLAVQLTALSGLVGSFAALLAKPFVAAWTFASNAVTGFFTRISAANIGTRLSMFSLTDLSKFIAKPFVAAYAFAEGVITRFNTALVVNGGVVGLAKVGFVSLANTIRGAVVAAFTRLTGVMVIFSRAGWASISGWFGKITASMLAFVATNGGVTGSIKALGASFVGLFKGGAIANGIKAIGTVIAGINWPIALLIAAVIGLGILWAKNWHGIHQSTKVVVDNIVILFKFLWVYISTFVEVLADVISSTFNWVVKEVGAAFNGIKNFLGMIEKYWTDTFDKMGESTNVFAQALGIVVDKVGGALKGVGGALGTLWKGTGIPDYFGSVGKEAKLTWDEQKKDWMSGGGWDPEHPFGNLFGGGAAAGTDTKEWDKQMAKMKKEMDDLTKKYTLTNPGKMDPSVLAAENEKKLQSLYESTYKQLQKKIWTYGKVSEASQMAYEVEKGDLVGLSPARKQTLLWMAAQVDQAKAQEEVGKRYKSLIDATTDSMTKSREAIALEGKDTEAQRLRIELSKHSMAGFVGWQRQSAEAAKDAAIETARLSESVIAIRHLQDEADHAAMPKWYQDFADSVGGWAKLKQMNFDEQTKALDAFSSKQSATDAKAVGDAINDSARAIMFLGNATQASAVQAVGGFDAWQRIPKYVQNVVLAMTALADVMTQLNDTKVSSLDELYDALHPIQTETEKAIHSIDMLIARAGGGVGDALTNGTRSVKTAPDAMRKFAFGDPHIPEPAIKDTFPEPNIPDMLGPLGSDFLKGISIPFALDFRKVDVGGLENLKRQVIEIKKNIDFANAQKQLKDWTTDFNHDASILNQKLTGTYNYAQAAVEDWKFQNRDALELIRRSYEQMGKPASVFDGIVTSISDHIRDSAVAAKQYENVMSVVEKIASIQNDMTAITAKDPFERFKAGFAQFNEETRKFAIPDGTEGALKQLFNVQGAAEQITKVRDSLQETRKTLQDILVTDPFEKMVTSASVLDQETGKLKLPPGYSEDLQRAAINAQYLVEGLGKMVDQQSDAQKLYQSMAARSPFQQWLLDFEVFDKELGQWKLPSNLDEQFLKAVYTYRQRLTMISSVAQAMTESIFAGVQEATKPDQEAIQQYKDLQKEIREAYRTLWTTTDEDAKSSIQDQINNLEKQADDMSKRVHKSVWDMFSSIIGAIYASFSKMLLDMASDIIKSSIAQSLQRMLLGAFHIGDAPGADVQAAQQAANSAQLQLNTAAITVSNSAQGALAAAIQTLVAPISSLPEIELQMSTAMQALYPTQQELTYTLQSTNSYLFDLSQAVKENTFAIQSQNTADQTQNLVGNLASGIGGGLNVNSGVSSAIGIGMTLVSGLGLLGRRAEGGPVQSGADYIAGEQGPEVVHMDRPGTVINNSRLRKMMNSGDESSGNTYHFHFDLSGVKDVNEFRRASGPAISDAKRRVDREFRRHN